ncbi:MAG TPA: hypothetical protein DCO79_14965 [Spirochaeta sp.]|nr:hypothetical protein [Spirochaeta sp.]
MNGRLRNILLLLITILIFTGVTAACARGNSEAGQPEQVAVKDPGENAVESVVENVAANAENADSDYPPEGWVTDIREAYKLAQAGDKQILLNFTGSDWCVWCTRLREEVFDTPEFQAFVDENLVMLYLDFPNSIDLPPEQIKHNQIIAQLLGIKGYPSIWLLDSDFSPLLATGYRKGGPGGYISHLQNDRPDISPEELENFRAGFTDAIEVNIGPLN